MRKVKPNESGLDGSGLGRVRYGDVEVWTIDRPAAANTMDAGVFRALCVASAATDGPGAPRVVVLTGAGPRVFCGGMDLRAFERGELDDVDLTGFYRVSRGDLGVPLIGAVNGAAIGGGLELLLGCDVAIAAEQSRFGLPEVSHGLVAASGAVQLPARIGLGAALEMGLTGEYISAARALELGLVNRVVPSGVAVSAAMALAGSIAAHDPVAVRETRQLMRASSMRGVEATWGEAETVGDRVRFSAASRQSAPGAATSRDPSSSDPRAK